LKYPDEFETPTFPAGKQVAVTRAVSVAIMSVFLLILFACGLLLWAQKSLINIAGAGRFAADRSIREYAENIWNLKVIK
jgi:glucan phosphorylase